MFFKSLLPGDTYYSDIVAGVHQGDTLGPYLLIICLDYVKDNGFKFVTERSRRYTAQTITEADYADDIALLANTPAQAEALLHNLERAAADKAEYMCFNQRGDISTQNGSSLKLVVKFTYLGSSVSLTETDINTRRVKAWTSGLLGHLRVTRPWTPALMLHLSNPFTEPKGSQPN